MSRTDHSYFPPDSRRWGFTLVELIVVIAILGILAGIAIPVYSGYIKKANQAADQQLLAAVNTAFAAACLEKDPQRNGMPDAAAAEINTADPRTLKVDSVTADGESVSTLFQKYYAGNEDSKFKYFTSLRYEKGKGFIGVGPDGSETTTSGILNSTYVWHDFEDAAAAYQISNFKNMGVEGVTGTVDNLAGALSDYPQLFRVVQTGLFKDTLDKLGIDLETADNATKANAAVFFVADQVSRMDTNAVVEALQNENLGEGGSGLDDYMATLGITGDDAIFLGTAIRYGIATAYVYSDFATAEEKAAFTSTTPNSRSSAVELIRNATAGDGYMAYIYDTIEDADTGSLEDTNAFFGILKAVSENTGGFADISSGGLFSNPEVLAKIKELLGETTP